MEPTLISDMIPGNGCPNYQTSLICRSCRTSCREPIEQWTRNFGRTQLMTTYESGKNPACGGWRKVMHLWMPFGHNCRRDVLNHRKVKTSSNGDTKQKEPSLLKNPTYCKLKDKWNLLIPSGWEYGNPTFGPKYLLFFGCSLIARS